MGNVTALKHPALAAMPVMAQPPKVEIIVNDRDSAEITNEAWDALLSRNSPPRLFLRNNEIVHVGRDEDDRVSVGAVTASLLDDRLHRVARFFRKNQDGSTREQACPERIVKRLLEHPNRNQLPALKSVVEVPTLRADGSVLSAPGYDTQSGLFYDTPPEALLIDVPSAPTRKEVSSAVDFVRAPLDDFPFADEASRTNLIALMLTVIARPALKADGKIPLAAIDAPAAGTGKTLLANVVSLICTGRAAATMSAPSTDDEMRKQLTAQLIRGSSLIVIDNIAGRMSWPSLEQFVTSSRWSDRVLGRSHTVELPQSATVIATGNNLQPAGDMIRRCFLIRLDAKMRRPFERTGFKHPDLTEWVSSNRGELVRSLLVIARNWYAAGKPQPKSDYRLGGFERWTAPIGGMLHAAGVDGFLGNQYELYEAVDEDDEQWSAFLAAIDQSLRLAGADPRRVTTKTVAREIEKAYEKHEEQRSDDESQLVNSLPDLISDTLSRHGSLSRSLGKQFASVRDRRFGTEEWRVEKTSGREARSVLWSIARGE